MYPEGKLPVCHLVYKIIVFYEVHMFIVRFFTLPSVFGFSVLKFLRAARYRPTFTLCYETTGRCFLCVSSVMYVLSSNEKAPNRSLHLHYIFSIHVHTLSWFFLGDNTAPSLGSYLCTVSVCSKLHSTGKIRVDSLS